MIRIPKETMTMRELDRLKFIQGLIDGQLNQHAVAIRLELTTRQVRRLVRQYEQQGPVGLISKLRNRPSNRRLKSDVAEHAFRILRSTYADFGPTLAAEKLRERHGVDLAGADYHSIKNELWRQIVPRSQGHGMLCHGCIQRRLGRALTPEDFYQRSEAVDSDDPLRGPDFRRLWNFG
jgi:hypothetical protein